MLNHAAYIFILSLGCISAAIIFFECISSLLIHCIKKKSFTRELRGGALMNPIFEKADSYQQNDTWRQGYNRDIAKIFNVANNALNKWQPLGMWSAPKYYGEQVNIGKYNLRKTTTNTKKISEKHESRVCFFGGSLVWGWGVRDKGTIPSQLLNLRNNTIIENHGQLGYVSSQSFIAFTQRMKHEPKPDIVILIDGLNDIYSAYQSKIAGIEQNATSRKLRAELKTPKNILEFYWNNSYFVKYIRSILPKEKIAPFPHSKNRDEKLAHSIINIYNKNVDFINAIASNHNIKAICIWPPTIFDKPSLTEYEKKVAGMLDSFAPLYSLVKNLIQNDHYLDPRVINLSNLFLNEKKPTYIDPWHYNEYANSLIAKKINELITSL